MKSNKVLELTRLTKDYTNENGYKIRLFEEMSFDIYENQFTTIIAPVGSGKSTLLRILAFVDTDFVGDYRTFSESRVVLIPDTPTSFQWQNVYENIKYIGKNLSDIEIQKIIDNVGLTGYESQYPHPSAVGFRLRISIARALASNASVILLDNVFHLIKDYKTKIDLLQLLWKLDKIYEKTTFVFATDDISEGIFLGEQILLMNKFPGKLVEIIENSNQEERNEDYFLNADFLNLRNEIEQKMKVALNQKTLNITA